MADSIRQKICAAVLAGHLTILKSNGYNSDLGKQMEEWRGTDFNIDDILPGSPGGTIADTLEEDSEKVTLHQDHDLTFELTVVLAEADQTPKIARQVIADTFKILGVDRTWGNLAYRTLAGKTEMDVSQDKKKIMGFRRTFKVVYRTRNFDPYNQG
jgi:hypothetical protein